MVAPLLYFKRNDRYKHFDFSDLLDEMATCGIDKLVLAPRLGGLDFCVENDVQKAARALKENGIQALGIHGLFAEQFDLNVCHEHMIPAHKELMRNAAGLGVKTYVVHSGVRDSVRQLDEQWNDVRLSLDRLVPYAVSLGVVIALENLPLEYLGRDPDDLVKLVEEYDSPALKLCFDSGHANLTGDAHEILTRMSLHVVTMHLHDNQGDRDEHLLPGEGTIDWPLLNTAIADCPNLIHIEIEGFNLNEWPHRDVYDHYLRELGLEERA